VHSQAVFGHEDVYVPFVGRYVGLCNFDDRDEVCARPLSYSFMHLAVSWLKEHAHQQQSASLLFVPNVGWHVTVIKALNFISRLLA